MNNVSVNSPDVRLLWSLSKSKQLVNRQGVLFSYFIFLRRALLLLFLMNLLAFVPSIYFIFLYKVLLVTMVKFTRLLRPLWAHFTKQKNVLRKKHRWSDMSSSGLPLKFHFSCALNIPIVNSWSSKPVFPEEEEKMGECPIRCCGSRGDEALMSPARPAPLFERGQSE